MPAGMRKEEPEPEVTKENSPEEIAERFGQRLAALERKNASYQAGFERLGAQLDESIAGSKAVPSSGEAANNEEPMNLKTVPYEDLGLTQKQLHRLGEIV